MLWLGVVGFALSLIALGWHGYNSWCDLQRKAREEADRDFNTALQAAYTEFTAGFTRAFANLRVPEVVASHRLVEHPQLADAELEEAHAIRFLHGRLTEMRDEGAYVLTEMNGANAEARVRQYFDIRNRLRLVSGMLLRRNLTHVSEPPEFTPDLVHGAKRALQESGTPSAMDLFNQL